MTFASYWKAKVKATPQISGEDGHLRISIVGLRRELEKAYDKGRADQSELHRIASELMRVRGTESDSDLFGRLFGGGLGK
jgi:hypothetical protein